MPFTPLHFGPGLVIKALLPRMSLTYFMVMQIVIDLETFWYILQGEWPIHRQLHTLWGATVAAILLLFPGRWFLLFLAKKWSGMFGRWTKVYKFFATISIGSALIGVMLGAWSHIALDAIMHADMNPWSPFLTTNPWLGWVTIDHLNLGCLLALLLGSVLMLFIHKPFAKIG